MNAVEKIEKEYLKSGLPAFNAGDTVRVRVKIKEGDKERLQAFEGTVIGRRGSGTRASFTVRKTSFSQGVERVFPLHSPVIHSIEVLKSFRARRAKLYYLRKLRGKAARLKLSKREVKG